MEKGRIRIACVPLTQLTHFLANLVNLAEPADLGHEGEQISLRTWRTLRNLWATSWHLRKRSRICFQWTKVQFVSAVCNSQNLQICITCGLVNLANHADLGHESEQSSLRALQTLWSLWAVPRPPRRRAQVCIQIPILLKQNRQSPRPLVLIIFVRQNLVAKASSWL